MGSIVGGGGAKRAAKRQARAIEEQTRNNVIAANAQAEAMAQQMANAQAMRVATKRAEELLSTPAEVAKVSLRPQDVDDNGDLLTRRRTTRSTYQRQPRNSGLSLIP